MCGILGEVDRRGNPAADPGLLTTLRHRGPDAEGFFTAPGVAIGQTRLAVIDLETGDPPITSEDRSVAAILNGEIYNYRELRRQLLADGHQLSTRGDTEVIAHLAEGDHADPTTVARRLDGMFAAAVWREPQRELWLIRDRVGKKPLYWFHDADRLVFGSELKAVLAHPRVPRDLDPGAIPAYLTFGYVPSPRTFFAGVRSLMPGTALIFGPTGAPRIVTYWQPPRPPINTARTFQETADAVRAGLSDAVARRLVADVPVGAFLSGGVDSSAIVGLMAAHSHRQVQTFTIGFVGAKAYDERSHARTIAARFSTDHHELVVSPDAVELVQRLVEHHDQPFGDSSAVPTFLLAELTRQHVTVALSGDGGDELFAGYERFGAALVAERYARLPAPQRAGMLDLTRRLKRSDDPRSLMTRVVRFQTRAGAGLPDALRAWVSYASEDELSELLPGADPWALDDYRAIWAESAGRPVLERVLELNLRTYLLDDLLVKADRTTMAHGLELRSPFLDTALVELAATIPASMKVRGPRLKHVLKRAVEDLLPAELLHRRKQGFGVPLDLWFRGQLHGYVQSMLGSGASRVRAHVTPSVLDRLLAEHASGAVSRGQILWALLTLEVFLRREGW